MTTIKQETKTGIRETSDSAKPSDQDEARERSTVSPATLGRVIAPSPRASAKHPDSPTTGLDRMSGSQWQACIAELCGRGYRITESIVTMADRTAASEIGYILAGETSPQAYDYAWAVVRHRRAVQYVAGPWTAHLVWRHSHRDDVVI